MNKLVTVLGGGIVVLAIAVAVYAGYAIHQAAGLDDSSKQYVEDNVPAVVSTWSKEELLKRGSPELLKVAADHPAVVDGLFRKLAGLGAMKRFGEVKGGASVAYTTDRGKVITANYVAQATFANGDAKISVRLIQSAGQWRILLFKVDSPFLLK
jgi:hypothetical protein